MEKERELCHRDYGEETEEEKMEKFFAIIRSMREVRDSLMTNGFDVPTLKKETADGSRKKRKVEDSDKTPPRGVGAWKPTFLHEDFISESDIDKTKGPVGGAWKPTFRREDFMSEPNVQLHTPSLTTVDNAPRNEVPDKEAIEEGLDLTLSL
ncbi:hypothetical protein K2173_008827 [Erythroxylum novogranatense]|uniref:Uncharacterized protein n=1 Tax=Erythroxylum novogranatense TaxID=1862640 RepID=A0AAV8UAD0_9ROSI|nr:hypothetical protein K2173_008827 [Erythroxylum novogranatense]